MPSVWCDRFFTISKRFQSNTNPSDHTSGDGGGSASRTGNNMYIVASYSTLHTHRHMSACAAS